MPTFYSDTATGQNSTNPKDRVRGNYVSGNVVYAKASYTTVTGIIATDVLNLAKLPKGAIVIPALCRITTEDCGTDVSCTIGDDIPTADADKYSTAISLSTAGTVLFVAGIAGANPVALTQEAWITLTFTDAGSYSLSVGADFTVWIAYLLP